MALAFPGRRAALRWLLAWLALALLLPMALAPRFAASGALPPAAAEEMSLGFTFSRRQAEYLGIPWRDTYRAVTELSPSVVRLGAYWDEIERQPGVFDFSTLDWLLERSAGRNVRVMLTVGMKAPRDPEYYLPGWLERRLQLAEGARVSDHAHLRASTLTFVRAVVERYRERDEIAYWQVENEPLDPSGPHHWQIGADFLAEEVALVRRLDPRRRPIVVNMWVESHPLVRLPLWRDGLKVRAGTILELADVIGLDVYPSRGVRVLGHDMYLNWSRSAWEEAAVELQQLARAAGKEAWIIEAQAEPWEPARQVYTEAAPSRSVQPTTAADTFARLRSAGFPTILFWGVEHWYMRQHRHQDDAWWALLSPFLAGRTRPAGDAGAPGAAETLRPGPAVTGGMRPLAR